MAESVLDTEISEAESSALGHRTLYCLFKGKQVAKLLNKRQFDEALDEDLVVDGFSGPVQVAQVVSNPNGVVQSLVLFVLPLTEHGHCIDGWHLPLRQLVDTASRGPNLGGGRIRLACQSQCAMSGHRDALWDPSNSTFSAIKKALGIYFSALKKEQEKDQSKPLSTAQSSSDGDNPVSEELSALRRELRNESAAYRNQLQVLQQEIERQRLVNERLTGTEESDVVTGDSRVDLHVLRQQNQQLSMKVRELKISNEKLRQQQPPILTTAVEQEDLFSNPEFILNKMDEHDVMSVVFHPGAGHINLTAKQLPDYLDDPIAYAAHHVSLNKEQYLLWLEHEKKPKCSVCDVEIPLVADPRIFDPEMDIYCDEHKPLDP